MIPVLVGYVVPVLHVLACLFLIVVVLLQTGKGADMGAVFGGGSQTLFGSGGAGNFLTRLTTGTAIAFMVTSLILTWGASRTATSRLLEKIPAASAPAPLAPAGDQPAANAAPGETPADEAPPAEAPAP
jgi:preprotein translocase subunit SecG